VPRGGCPEGRPERRELRGLPAACGVEERASLRLTVFICDVLRSRFTHNRIQLIRKKFRKAAIGLLMSELPLRFSGIPTFFSCQIAEKDKRYKIGIMGIPFDTGTTFRPGARFAPNAIRQISKITQFNYHPFYDSNLSRESVADFGDIVCTPHDCERGVKQIYDSIVKNLEKVEYPIYVGGDHTIVYASVRALSEKHKRKIALIHFDAHLDTADSYFGCSMNHGTALRRLAEEGFIDPNKSFHVGSRGTLYNKNILMEDKKLGFTIFGVDGIMDCSPSMVSHIYEVCENELVYISVDIDVLDPSHAPGTGTPACAGLSTRELFNLIRSLSFLNIVGGDVVEVCPAYDHADLTTLCAAEVIVELAYAINCAKSSSNEPKKA